jgi:DNA mismatch repair protein MutS
VTDRIPRAEGDRIPRAEGDRIPRAEGATPALAQWFAAKAAHPDALVFFRMGDFFELFFADAEDAAAILDIAVSHRGEHRGQPVPMAGVPVHALDAYLARLIRAGHRVAICDQMETPEQAKRRKAPTIRREVVRVVTPATLTEDGLLDATRPAWLLALAEPEPQAGHALGAAWLDISTGAFFTTTLPRAELGGLLARLEPAEAVISATPGPGLAEEAELARRLPGRIAPRLVPRDAARTLHEAYGVATLDGFGRFEPAELAAAALALSYVQETQAGALPRLDPPRSQAGETGVLALDAATRRSLEILRDQRGGSEATLLGAVDRTLTASGARELASRLACPLAEPGPIAARHDAVAFLLGDEATRGAIRAALKGAPDTARALARLALDRFAPRDLGALRHGLDLAARLVAVVEGAALPVPRLVADAARALRLDPALGAELGRALADRLPARLEDGGIIAPGYDGELDALRRLRDGGRDAIAALQLDLAQAWGVASLKIRHHQQFGFLAEVPAAAGQKLAQSVPAAAAGPMAPIHRQTMANAMRFTCAALAELDRKVAEAGERAAARERACVHHLRRLLLDAGSAIAEAAGRSPGSTCTPPPRRSRPRAAGAGRRCRTAPSSASPPAASGGGGRAEARPRAGLRAERRGPLAGAAALPADRAEHGGQVHLPSPERALRHPRPGGVLRAGGQRADRAGGPALLPRRWRGRHRRRALDLHGGDGGDGGDPERCHRPQPGRPR